MDREYVQHLRYKLQKRVRRLNSSNYPVFHDVLDHVWKWITSQPTFVGILDDLAKRYPDAQADALRISNGDTLRGTDEVEHVAIAACVLKICTTAEHPIEQAIELRYRNSEDTRLEYFKDNFVEPVYEYLDEQLDDQRAILALLRKYKKKCEWFQRESLFKIWSDDTRHGEKRLGMNMYEYLHDQGLEFSIEPASASGEADLVSMQDSDDPLIAEAKIFHPDRDKGKGYLKTAFQQVYRYTVDFTQPFGYLIIFKTCEDDLKLTLTHSEQFTPSVTFNNKMIFFLVIDIFCYAESASQRPPLKVVEITEADLTTNL